MILAADLVQLSRWQFAVTAMFHWLFVPLTLGLGFIIAIMETKYYRTGDEFWKRVTKFWMKIFAVNFAVGVATGIILEFEFGTNWSNYSWFVGDIFGAPLAIEGIFAFFLESTFFAVMFFGWNKVSKKAHLVSTWLTAIGTNLSAWWILVANGWMQYPVGMAFNADTARNEMVNFAQVAFSPVAVTKFFHSVTNGYVLACVVVIGISAWFLLKKREEKLAVKSIKIASVFGIISLAVLIFTGDSSGNHAAKYQPMKLAAMEGLYDGGEGVPLVGVGILNPKKDIGNDEKTYLFQISIPKGLSLLANRKLNSFVPGINNIIAGDYQYINRNGERVDGVSFYEARNMGLKATSALAEYQQAKKDGDQVKQEEALKTLNDNFDYFGYSYLNEPADIVPNVPLVFYSFRVMVLLGCYFILFFIVFLVLHKKKLLTKYRWILIVAIISVPLVYICSMSGWVVAEVGRQPWTIQNLLPVNASVSGIESSNVLTTLIIFIVLFTTLLIVEMRILFKQIKKGPDPEDEPTNNIIDNQ